MVLHKNNSLITLSFITITILSGLYLSSSSSSATSASTSTATVKVAASCTLTTSGGGNYSATVPNGTSAEISGSTLSVSCNDAGGFALYAVGYSNDTVGNNNMIGTNTNISTATSGTNSYWAMKINPTTGNTPTIENSFNNYHIVPDVHTKIASYASSTGTGSLSVDATYKANISSTQLAGNYLGKVKYTLVHPANEIPQQEIACDPGKICYNANTNIVEGQMGKQSASNNTDVNLWAPNFKKQDYGFAGWSDKYDYETNPDAHFYGPNQTITTPADTSTNGLSLYAVWIESEGTMQSDALSICHDLHPAHYDGTAELDSISALTDERDNDTYAIAKLADGNCWMIENLRLDDSARLTSSNTNDPSLPITNYYSLTDPVTSNHLSSSSNSWCEMSSSSCADQSMLNTDNTTLFINNTTSNYSIGNNVYSYGNYYNWYSSTAGYGKFGSEYGSTYVSPGDICPMGWRLPTGGGTSDDFGLLDVELGGTGTTQSDSAGVIQSKIWRSYPNNFIYSGTYRGNSNNNLGVTGMYWSSSGGWSTSSGTLWIEDDSIIPGNQYTNKNRGDTIRCIAQPAT